MNYFKVALQRALFEPLTYSSNKAIPLGQRVQAPLGSNNISARGVVLGHDPQGHKVPNLKAIQKIESGFPPLGPQRAEWIQWLGHYYHYPVGLVAAMCFPPLPFKKAKSPQNGASAGQALSKEEDFQGGAGPAAPAAALTPDQSRSAEAVLKSSGFQVFLLCGVTGSGKTEVYKKIAGEVLRRGDQALLLLPEIFLTPQMLRRFSESFPGQTAVMHSGLTPRQKTSAWQQMIQRKKSLLIGTRSALFCPMPRLQLIVVDEEHEGSFKQEDKLVYHARDSAIMLARLLDIPIILGSGTPSLTSLYQAKLGKYKLLRLTKRALNQPMPKTSLADLKIPPSEGQPFWMSDKLRAQINDVLSRGRQAALFLNRRGRASAIICSACGHIQKCANCDISLTLHGESHLLCHYCSYLEKKPEICPSCRRSRLLEKGLGTEGVERGLKNLFPKAQIIRADRDAIDSKEEMEEFIKIVESGRPGIIIGTQMIAKGLDFPSIDLVGLLLADLSFHFPDFRASERAMQILLQMTGRAGRKSAGSALIQTFNPDHQSLAFAARQDYLGFAEEELKSREKFFYPPFSRLCLFRVESSKEAAAREDAGRLGQTARRLAGRGLTVLGPSPAPVFKIKNRFRIHILIKAAGHARLQSFLDVFLKSFKARRFVQVKMNRDPVSMM